MDVHRLKFIDLQARAITCLAFDASVDFPRLAVSRSDASIEIWRYIGSHKDFCYCHTIPGREGVSIESLKWSGDRLFSSGLSGIINEWRVNSLVPVQSVDSKGSPIWSMEINNDGSSLAIGCEDGSICLYDLTDDSLTYSRTLSKQEGRILSLSWHPVSPRIAVGCADSTLRVLDAKTGHSILRITLDKNENQETLVWSVRFLSDDTIVSGSSLGRVGFWNSKYGTLRQSFVLHTADVLTLAVNSEEDTLFAAGVDHKIIRFKKVKTSKGEAGGEAWVQACEVRPHSHDVRSLGVSRNGILVSGGVDTELCFNKMEEFEKEMTLRQSPFIGWSERFQLASSANILLFRDNHSLKLWKVTPHSAFTASAHSSSACSPDKDALAKSGTVLSTKEMETDLLRASGLPLYLLEIKSSSPNHIVSSGISDDGKFVVFSDVERLWVYLLEPKVTCIVTQFLPSRTVAIYSNTESINSNVSIAICPSEGGVRVSSFLLPVSKKDSIIFKEMEVKKKKKSPGIHIKVQYSLCGRYLLAMSEKYRITIYDAMTSSLFATLPRFDSTFPPSITFTNSSTRRHLESDALLIFTSGDQELYKYDLEKAALKSLGKTKRHKLLKRCFSRKVLSMTQGLSTLPTHNGVCMLYDWDRLMFLRYETKEKQRKGREEEEEVIGKKRSLATKELECDIKSYHDLVYAGMLGCGEMIIIEKPWTDRITRLPPTLKIDKYGQ